ncbi:unnamed protein product, partial [Mesorhabditis spiculigera]
METGPLDWQQLSGILKEYNDEHTLLLETLATQGLAMRQACKKKSLVLKLHNGRRIIYGISKVPQAAYFGAGAAVAALSGPAVIPICVACGAACYLITTVWDGAQTDEFEVRNVPESHISMNVCEAVGHQEQPSTMHAFSLHATMEKTGAALSLSQMDRLFTLGMIRASMEDQTVVRLIRDKILPPISGSSVGRRNEKAYHPLISELIMRKEAELNLVELYSFLQFIIRSNHLDSFYRVTGYSRLIHGAQPTSVLQQGSRQQQLQNSVRVNTYNRGQAKPHKMLKLCLFNEERPQAIEENFAELLRIVDGKPVIFVGLFGPARQGKTMLLELFRLLGLGTTNWDRWNTEIGGPESMHFVSGSDAITEGLEVSSTPILARDKNGKECYILLIDTQGMYVAGDPAAKSNFVHTIFATGSVDALNYDRLAQNIERPADEALLRDNFKPVLFIVDRDTKNPLTGVETGLYARLCKIDGFKSQTADVLDRRFADVHLILGAFAEEVGQRTCAHFLELFTASRHQILEASNELRFDDAIAEVQRLIENVRAFHAKEMLVGNEAFIAQEFRKLEPLFHAMVDDLTMMLAEERFRADLPHLIRSMAASLPVNVANRAEWLQNQLSGQIDLAGSEYLAGAAYHNPGQP